MEYYQYANKQYKTRTMWAKRCCLGVVLATACVLSISLLSGPSSGVRSSRLVNFNGTETAHPSGVFDRLTGHFQAAKDALWSWGGFWDDLEVRNYWPRQLPHAPDLAQDEDYWGGEDDEEFEDESELEQLYDAAEDDADALEAAEGIDEAPHPRATVKVSVKPAAKAQAAARGESAEERAEIAEELREEAAEERAEAAADELELEELDRLADRPTGPAGKAKPAAVESKDGLLGKAAEDGDREELDELVEDVDGELEAVSAKAAAKGKGGDALALEDAALEKEEIAEEKQEAAEAAYEKKEELEEELAEAEEAGDMRSEQQLEPLVEKAEAEYAAKEAQADVAMDEAQEAEAAADAAAKEPAASGKGWGWGKR